MAGIKGRFGPLVPFSAGAAVSKHRILTFSGESVIHASGPDDSPVGISDRPARIGETLDVTTYGVMAVELGGVVSAGDKVASGADGKAILSSYGHFEVGTALRDGVAGGTVEVLLDPGRVDLPVLKLMAGGAIVSERIVKFNSAGKAVHATAATDNLIGVAISSANQNQEVLVAVGRRVKLTASEAVTRGSLITAAAAGKGKATTTADDRVIGLALSSAAAADNEIDVLIHTSRI